MENKRIGFFTACSLVIANMVGTGVFSSLGFQVVALPSVSILLFLWVCGGIVALCGGLSYIELARLYPGSGGEYHYVRSVYPKVISYFSGVVSILAGFAAPVALAAITFSTYFSQFYSPMSEKGLSILVITVITLVHCFSVKLGSRFQLVTTAVKLTVLLIFIGAGFFASGSANPLVLNSNALSLIATKGFAVSLVYVLFAYSGWNACVYIFNEIKNPEKNISRSILIGTSLVTLLYVLLNFIFLKTVPMAHLAGVIEVGAVSATAIFGTAGGKLMAIIIAIMLISTMSAMIWVGPRVADSMFAFTKAKAMLLQYLVTVALLVTETFEQILLAAGLLLCISSCLCVAILFVGKKRLPLKKMLAPTIFLIANIYTIIVLLT